MFCAVSIDPSLLIPKGTIFQFALFLRSQRSPEIEVDSRVAKQIAMYSASHEERATHVSF